MMKEKRIIFNTRYSKNDLINFKKALEIIGISRSTFIRYEDDGRILKVDRDGRNWRKFTNEVAEEIKKQLEDQDLI